MAILPFAHYTPLSFVHTLPVRSPVAAAILHTNDGGPDLKAWFDHEYERTHNQIGTQFQVLKDGGVVQLTDSDLAPWHAYSASKWAVGIETEDDGHPERPWADAQLHSIVRVLHYLKVPARAIRSPDAQAGVGYHGQYVRWNLSGHHCPGPTRVHQLWTEVVPALGGNVATQPWPGRVLAYRPGNLMHGEDVTAAQHRLIRNGYALVADGWYGPRTLAVVRAFQVRAGLVDDGKVGRLTWHELWARP